MKLKKLWFACALGAAMTSGFAIGQMRRHPNLENAARYCQQAINSITAAQRYNEFDMNGHAARAKQMLLDAQRELQAAAGAASR